MPPQDDDAPESRQSVDNTRSVIGLAQKQSGWDWTVWPLLPRAGRMVPMQALAADAEFHPAAALVTARLGDLASGAGSEKDWSRGQLKLSG